MNKYLVNGDNIERLLHFIYVKYSYYNRIYDDFLEEEKEIFNNWLKVYDNNNIDLIGIEGEELFNAIRKRLEDKL